MCNDRVCFLYASFMLHPFYVCMCMYVYMCFFLYESFMLHPFYVCLYVMHACNVCIYVCMYVMYVFFSVWIVHVTSILCMFMHAYIYICGFFSVWIVHVTSILYTYVYVCIYVFFFCMNRSCYIHSICMCMYVYMCFFLYESFMLHPFYVCVCNMHVYIYVFFSVWIVNVSKGRANCPFN